MIRKMQRRFVLIAVGAVAIVMGALVIMINALNYRTRDLQIDAVLTFISGSGGTLPEITGVEKGKDGRSDQLPLQDFSELMRSLFRSRYNMELTKDSALQIRFFTVWTNENGEVQDMYLEHIAEVSSEKAADFAEEALADDEDRGHIEGEVATYNYKITKQDRGAMIVFLDTTSYHESSRHVLFLSLSIGFFSLILIVVIILALSKRAIRPMVRNLENQRQFITNAGHELKTPIAIISANAELLEMMNGENEWTQSIRHQARRLSGLVANLITLSKMGEQSQIVLRDIDFAPIVKESAESFRPLIEQQHKSLHLEVEDSAHFSGEEKLAAELVNILLDNATKYCDEEGRILVNLHNRRHAGLRFSVSNTYAEGRNVDYTRFFDRFYRQDESHNSAKAGFGIGLSMAQDIVTQFRGKIGVSWKDGMITFTVTI